MDALTSKSQLSETSQLGYFSSHSQETGVLVRYYAAIFIHEQVQSSSILCDHFELVPSCVVERMEKDGISLSKGSAA